MAGIYIHIPFCRQACHYCDFHFSTSKKMTGPLTAALEQEIRQRPSDEEVRTIYFGGGTPSVLALTDLVRLLDAVRESNRVAADAEITLEANPDDLSVEYLAGLREAGVNRLSIGIQSFRDADLLQMNRTHTASEAQACVQRAQAAGFQNITVDLIYGLPGLSDADWNENLDKAFDLAVPHVSAYCLTIEPRTALAHFVKTGKIIPAEETAAAEQFRLLMRRMKENGFEQYEISNFAKPGFRSRHNCSYWLGEKYTGIGPSAHSYDGTMRRWNIANNAQYAAKIRNGEIFWEEETLTENERYNEFLMIGLRTTEGCNLQKLDEDFGAGRAVELLAEAAPYLASGDLLHETKFLRLSENGKLLADRIASDLFRV